MKNGKINMDKSPKKKIEDFSTTSSIKMGRQTFNPLKRTLYTVKNNEML